MIKGTLYIAPPGTGNRKTPIFGEIISCCPENDFSSVCYLAPNSYILSDTKTRFFSYVKKARDISSYIPFQPLTIKQLASDLHEMYGEKSAISDHIRTLILCEILNEKNMGYARLLADLLKKIRHHLPGKDLSRIKEETGRLIFEEKAADRAARALDVLRAYEETLKEKKIADPEDLLINSVSLIKESVMPGLLVIDGFFDPTPVELEIIEALMDKAERVILFAEENTGILKYFNTSGKWEEMRKLNSGICRKNTAYYAWPSMEDEVEGIAGAVKKVIIEGVRPQEVSVCFPLLSKYLPMVRRVFQRYGIPMNISSYSLSSAQPVVILEEMINCIEEDYSRSDFLSLLISPYMPAIPDIVRERAVSYSYAAGVVRGRQSWLSVRDTLLSSRKNEFLGDDKELLDAFQKDVGKIIAVIENIKAQKSLSSFIDAFESALDRFGFFDALGSDRMPDNGDDISGKISNLLIELRRLAGIYESEDSFIEAPSACLRYLLQGLQGSEDNRDGVKIVPPELAAGIETKALFFGGVLEGDFPARPGIDPILPEKVKKAMGMPHLEYYLNRQKLYFKRLLNVSAREPCISCPSADGDKVFLPSPFLDWGESLSPPALNIFTEEDVLTREGAAAHSSPADRNYLGGDMSLGGKTVNTLLRGTGPMSKGYINVTDLEFFRKCPRRFYIEKVLGLEPVTPPKFEVEARLWGSLAHKTMENLFKEGDIEINNIDSMLFSCLDQSLKQFPIGDFWSRVAGEIFRTLLPLLRDQEHDIRDQGYHPVMVEKKLTAKINNLKLKGKIDRVDRKQKSEVRSQKSEIATRDTVILLDYKTGAVDRDSLQMPLYARMWQENFPERVEKVGYYSLKEGRVNWYPKKITMEEFIDKAMHKAEELAGNLQNGLFPPHPFHDRECGYCYHSPVCNSSGG